MYMIMEAQALMPRSCYGASSYKRIALVELDKGCTERPAMISERSKGLKRIICVIEPVYAGTQYPNGRCSASKAHRVLKERF